MSDIPTRLLHEALRGRTASIEQAACIDAETLAAWADDTLPARERAAAESHASTCPRCQALLAAMARTMPLVTRRAWWRTTTVRWLVPFAAAAAVVLLWMIVPMTRLDQTVVRPRAVKSSVPTTASAASEPVAPPIPPPPATPKSRRDAGAPSPARPPHVAARSDERRAAAAPTPNAAAPSGVEPSPFAPPGAKPSAAATASELSTQSALTDARPRSDQMTASRVRGGVAAKLVAVPTEIVSPVADVRWRILMNGGVARSIDGGATWQAQSTGVLVTLTAGTAPSPTTCWLVGPAGVIVLSTDGRAWRRLPFPEAIELSSIRATDGQNATVTAADGRTFTTSDGGTTWQSP